MTVSKSTCCTVPKANEASVGRNSRFIQAIAAIVPTARSIQSELCDHLVDIPAGHFDFGASKSKFPADLDSPRQRVKLGSFQISPTAVSNREFARFVAETGYCTVAEVEGWSFVFHVLLEDKDSWLESPSGLPWWRKVNGASWRKPEGPDSSIADRDTHPAVHLCWYDAKAYCRWAGLRLPSEIEWERAARGGLARMKFPWGNALLPDGAFAMNSWQGDFPNVNTAEDGFVGTAPVDAYPPNAYGLYNTTGNVWEWVEDKFSQTTLDGPKVEHQNLVGEANYARVQRGGSYLCHVSYCDRYHVHSRTSNDADSSTGNCGFRVAA
jgi:sulfatase modifying factor 1